MNYLELFKKIGSIKIEVKKVHQLALSNRLSDDDTNKEFEKLDKKLFSFEKAIVEVFGLKSGDYEYHMPGIARPNDRVTKELISSKLAGVSNNLQQIQDGLKATNYKVVDKSANKYEYLSNGVRSLLTKAITNMKTICDMYALEEEGDSDK